MAKSAVKMKESLSQRQNTVA